MCLFLIMELKIDLSLGIQALKPKFQKLGDLMLIYYIFKNEEENITGTILNFYIIDFIKFPR